MDSKTFDKFRELIYDVAGIRLADGKLALVRARIGKRLRALGLYSSKEYLDYIKADKSKQEIVNLLDVISTNVTNFFRESEHFDVLSRQFEEWLEGGQRKFRFWSAGCSSGQEPYTIAMTLLEVLRKTGRSQRSLDIKILATDISTKVLNIADRGEYDHDKISGIPRALLSSYFNLSTTGTGGKSYVAKHNLRSLIVFKRLNLSKPPFPMRGPMDAIFCRNTMIYFDNVVRQRLVSEFQRLNRKDGILFVGHSESLTGFDSSYNAIKPSVYRKTTTFVRKAS